MKNNMPSKCERCGTNAPNTPYTMSFFNKDWICGGCKTAEVRHPAYLPAKFAEIAAYNGGNKNFIKTSVPTDLYINNQAAVS